MKRAPFALGAPTLLLAALFAASGACAAPSGALPKSGFTNGDFTVETDTTNYNFKTGEFVFPHHVRFTRPGTDVTGDTAAGNSQRNTITITGNVVLHQTGPISGLGSGTSHLNGEPSTLTTDKLSIEGRTKVYTATGSVHFVQGARTATADRGVLNEDAHTLDLSGNVHISEGEQSMAAESVHYNTLTEDVEAHGAPVLMRAPAFTPGPLAPASAGTKKPRR